MMLLSAFSELEEAMHQACAHKRLKYPLMHKSENICSA
jgi:hypothetical protein